MGALIDCITFDCAEPRRLAAFWSAALDYAGHEDKGHWVTLRPTRGAGPLLGFQRVPEPKVVKDRVHLDLRPTAGVTMEAEVARLAGLGGRQVRLVDDDPASVHVIMQDPEGNEFCVVRP